MVWTQFEVLVTVKRYRHQSLQAFIIISGLVCQHFSGITSNLQT